MEGGRGNKREDLKRSVLLSWHPVDYCIQADDDDNNESTVMMIMVIDLKSVNGVPA